MKSPRLLAAAAVLMVGCRGIIGLGPATLEEEDAGVDSGVAADAEMGAKDSGTAQEASADSGADMARDAVAPPEDSNVDSMVADSEQPDAAKDASEETKGDARQDAADAAQDSSSALVDSTVLADSRAIELTTEMETGIAETGIAETGIVDATTADTLDSTVRDTSTAMDSAVPTGLSDAAIALCEDMTGPGDCPNCCQMINSQVSFAVSELALDAGCFCSFADGGNAAMACSGPGCSASVACSTTTPPSSGSACSNCFPASFPYCRGQVATRFPAACAQTPGCAELVNCIASCPMP